MSPMMIYGLDVGHCFIKMFDLSYEKLSYETMLEF
jgi:hypothetical protein